MKHSIILAIILFAAVSVYAQQKPVSPEENTAAYYMERAAVNYSSATTMRLIGAGLIGAYGFVEPNAGFLYGAGAAGLISMLLEFQGSHLLKKAAKQTMVGNLRIAATQSGVGFVYRF